jgi:hypothetical protein
MGRETGIGPDPRGFLMFPEAGPGERELAIPTSFYSLIIVYTMK